MSLGTPSEGFRDCRLQGWEEAEKEVKMCTGLRGDQAGSHLRLGITSPTAQGLSWEEGVSDRKRQSVGISKAEAGAAEQDLASESAGSHLVF